MKFNELSDWPPLWVSIDSKSSNFATGEIGALTCCRAVESRWDYLEIIIEHEGGSIAECSTSTQVSEKVVEILEGQGGCLVKKIGLLEIK